MRVLLQSPGLAMVAVSGPPDALVKSTTPVAAAWLPPKFEPSRTMVAPSGAAGAVAPLTVVTTGGRESPVGPLEPHAARSRAAGRLVTETAIRQRDRKSTRLNSSH